VIIGVCAGVAALVLLGVGLVLLAYKNSAS
jgi:hypothetical protein